jgi:hypothetical protein
MALGRSGGSSSATAPLALATAPTVARSAAGTTTSQPDTGIVSGAPSASTAPPPPLLAPTATAVVQRVEGTPPAPPEKEEAEGHSDNELDELARAIFGRIRNQLRYEYVYEREAKGLTFDQS